MTAESRSVEQNVRLAGGPDLHGVLEAAGRQDRSERVRVQHIHLHIVDQCDFLCEHIFLASHTDGVVVCGCL